MATLKATVKSKRKDGMYVVYIRFAHNRKVSYLRTSWMVNDKGLSRNKKDIIDPYVIQQTSKLIDQYYNTMNRIDTQDWTVKEIVDYIQKGKDGISFSMYARKHIEKMKARGQERTSRDYKWALYSLEKFAGDNEIMFSQLTYSFLSRWIDSTQRRYTEQKSDKPQYASQVLRRCSRLQQIYPSAPGTWSGCCVDKFLHVWYQ